MAKHLLNFVQSPSGVHKKTSVRMPEVMHPELRHASLITDSLPDLVDPCDGLATTPISIDPPMIDEYMLIRSRGANLIEHGKRLIIEGHYPHLL